MHTIIKILFLLLVAGPVASQIEWNKYEPIRTIGGSSPEKLAKDITESYESDEEKLQAIYYWVTHNIAYDLKLFEKMKKSKKDKKKYSKKDLKEKERKEVIKTLKSNKGVCQQYSNVFKALCEAVGIQCVFVGGYAKGNPMKSGLGIKHAWNAVYLDGNWYLVDTTFGAGYVDQEDEEFRYAFEPVYFISDPDAFKMNHLPSQNKWQLTEEKITKAVYKNNPGIASGYYKNQINMLYPNSFRVDATKGEPLEISFSSPQSLEKIRVANLRKEREITAELTSAGDAHTISVDTEELKSGVYGIFNGQQLLFSYRISVN